jgi:hypothetical protein
MTRSNKIESEPPHGDRTMCLATTSWRHSEAIVPIFIDRGAPIYARARHRGQQVPFLRNRFRKAEFTRPWHQSSGVSPAAPPHSIGTDRG